MSRSRKRTSIMGIADVSEKYSKQLWHRSMRQGEKMRLNKHVIYGDDDFVLGHFREYSNVWGMAKDGKQYLSGVNRITGEPFSIEKYMRK